MDKETKKFMNAILDPEEPIRRFEKEAIAPLLKKYLEGNATMDERLSLLDSMIVREQMYISLNERVMPGFFLKMLAHE